MTGEEFIGRARDRDVAIEVGRVASRPGNQLSIERLNHWIGETPVILPG